MSITPYTKQIKIFDTTLRDGEQSPGCAMNLLEKMEMALQLERLGVNILEAGFAAASKGDFESVSQIASTIRQVEVASLSRALPKDIDLAYEALKGAISPRIHTFIATSELHMRYKLKMEPEAVIEQAVSAVKYAASKTASVEFSAEDATRSEPAFMARLFDQVILAGATTINVPDTVGYTTPDEYAKLILKLLQLSKHLHKVDLSVHCHNDLGLAVANSLAAVGAGATQVECTINGIGERAGNAALEEVVMALATRGDQYQSTTSIHTKEIARTSKLLSSITGVKVQPNKAIVGANAFAHESGIHQHGLLAHRETYEIMNPESIGLSKTQLVLGKHSGKSGLAKRVASLGYNLEQGKLETLFEAFKHLADVKKQIFDEDIEALIMRQQFGDQPQAFKLKEFVINSGSTISATATVHLEDSEGQIHSAVAFGDGPVDASFKAIDQIYTTDKTYELSDYGIRSVTEGNDALGEATIKLKTGQRHITGTGVSTDIIEASILAYLQGIHKLNMIRGGSHENPQ